MTDKTDAQIPQVVCRQGRQDRTVDLIFAECRLVPFEAKAPQPTPDVHHRALTLACCCRAAEQGDELAAATHSITSSARASRVGGRVRPSAFAALRLMTSSYLVGA